MVEVASAPATVDEYLGLIPPFNATLPKFTATIGKLVEPFAILQGVIGNFPADYDVDTAVGAQLDVVGIWVGWPRYLPKPIEGLYFSLDVPELGFDKGIWKGPFDPDNGIVRLDDDTYRMFIKAKILANSWDGTMGQAVDILDVITVGEASSNFAMFDNQDGSITIAITGDFPSTLFLAMIDEGYFPLKPSGYWIRWEMTSAPGTPIFGFDISNDVIGGFDEGSWGITPEYYLTSYSGTTPEPEFLTGPLIHLQVI